VKLRFLGTGTSFGIPVIGCSCVTCTSKDPRDQRTRHGALLQSDAASSTLLIDTPPELRLQLIAAGSPRVDAIFYTHAHADHTHGIDDLRAFSGRRSNPLVAWADTRSALSLQTKFPYIFDENYAPPEGTTKPEIRLRTFEAGERVRVADFDLLPFEVPHGDMPAFGFRVGDLGYVTDAKLLPAAARHALEGVRVLVLNALWFGNPHPTHFNVEEAVQIAYDLHVERTYLTHLTHRVTHQQLLDRLPGNVLPAYDGLVVDV
jgi:phosphoribosyl 1,2-cyclic phosphate phosphodiesterase